MMLVEIMLLMLISNKANITKKVNLKNVYKFEKNKKGKRCPMTEKVAEKKNIKE